MPYQSDVYTSKIIKAGALIEDTKTLLASWDLSCTVDENLDKFLSENIFGKASRSRVKDILAIFRQRYLVEAPVTKALVTLVNHRLPADALNCIFYFHATQSDRLLHDAVTNLLAFIDGICSLANLCDIFYLWHPTRTRPRR
ncbi:hypothetical protein NIES4071_82070 [Calothrix sp. NIES-4071]|nr:hypothetical protein NIES4071_82070 [Calothrix sp. NIES-4071]BAZ62476.1 hypothetical protein NIES4105_82000 [Calothrix sp. NIES-4105]